MLLARLRQLRLRPCDNRLYYLRSRDPIECGRLGFRIAYSHRVGSKSSQTRRKWWRVAPDSVHQVQQFNNVMRAWECDCRMSESSLQGLLDALLGVEADNGVVHFRNADQGAERLLVTFCRIEQELRRRRLNH